MTKSGKLPWLRPDAKSQVTIKYVDGKPVGIDTVVISTQHTHDISHEPLTEAVIEEIVKPVIPSALLKGTRHLINPTGRFVIGGPQGETGLTGRKIIVDTYGGYSRHGGGAFAGKDPSKVDRSAAYAGRYVAKNIVAAGLATKCEVQVAYAIDVAKPVSVLVETFGTGKISDEKIAKLVEKHFDLRPKGIIHSLDLLRPIYEKTAAYGHFSRNEPTFSGEKTDKAAALKCRRRRLIGGTNRNAKAPLRRSFFLPVALRHTCSTLCTRTPSVRRARPFSAAISSRNAMPATCAPSRCSNCAAAAAVPPVASTSSISSTRAPCSSASLWISSDAEPYSSA